MDTDYITKAREADTRIAAEWDKAYDQADRVREIDRVIKASGNRLAFYAKQPTRLRSEGLRIEKLEAKREDAVLVATELSEAADQLDNELYGGWNRFFLVQHIHNSTRCSSFRRTTRITWLPSVSGMTEYEAVAEHGEALCTLCFPSAPTELTTKKADPAICTGTPDWSQPSETRRMSMWAACSGCGENQTLTTALNLRKHKK